MGVVGGVGALVLVLHHSPGGHEPRVSRTFDGAAGTHVFRTAGHSTASPRSPSLARGEAQVNGLGARGRAIRERRAASFPTVSSDVHVAYSVARCVRPGRAGENPARGTP